MELSYQCSSRIATFWYESEEVLQETVHELAVLFIELENENHATECDV
jgi:hypothetical protein